MKALFQRLQQRTQEVVSVMERCKSQGSSSSEQAVQAGTLLYSISEDVQTIMDMSTQIATAIDEQNQVASEVNKNVVKIRDIAEQAATHAETNAQTSEEVSAQAEVCCIKRLKSLMFNLNWNQSGSRVAFFIFKLR